MKPLRFVVVVLAFVSPSLARPATVGELKMTEVDVTNSTVEITNLLDQPITVGSPLYFCEAGTCGNVSIPGATVFAAGQSLTFVISAPPLSSTLSDIWLYRDTNYSDPASIITGMKYGGSTAVGHEAEAVTAGKWPFATAFVPHPGAGQSLKLNSDNPAIPTAWIAGTPNPGAYIGTGAAQANYLPNIPKGTVQVELQSILTGLVSPVGMIEPDDGSGRMFVYDQAGAITIVQNGSPLAPPFADLSGRLVVLNPGYDERGLLGLALHPNYAATRKLYTYTSEPTGVAADFSTMPIGVPPNHQSVIAEWSPQTGNPNLIDPASRREILRIDQPQSNHNAGQMDFGADGYLYIALGDGGAGDDQGSGHGTIGNGQDINTILGTIVRIDVDLDSSNPVSANGKYEIPSTNPFVGAPGLDEIYAYGFRNPFRFSFDTATNALYVADVGQNNIEELDLVAAGQNCGWNLKEGGFYFDPNGGSSGFATTIPSRPLPDGVPLIDPIAHYDHNDGTSVIGGYVYHGAALPDLQNKYVFGDFSRGSGTPAGRLFYLDTGNAIRELVIGATDRPLGYFLKGMAQDSQGAVYALCTTSLGPSGTTGIIFKLVPVPPARVEGWEAF